METWASLGFLFLALGCAAYGAGFPHLQNIRLPPTACVTRSRDKDTLKIDRAAALSQHATTGQGSGFRTTDPELGAGAWGMGYEKSSLAACLQHVKKYGVNMQVWPSTSAHGAVLKFPFQDRE